MKLKKHLVAAGALASKLGAAIDIRDRFCFGGLAMVGYGAHTIYPPAGWIVVGVVLYWIGIRGR
jgi:hypothetical protein